MIENTIHETPENDSARAPWPASSPAAVGPAKGVRRLVEVRDLLQTDSQGHWDALVPLWPTGF